MKKIFSFILIIISLILIPSVLAHCPLCTGAVIAGAAGAKYLGFDAIIVGIFVGGAAFSLGVWMSRLIKKHYLPFQSLLIIIITFLLTVLPASAAISDTLYLPVQLPGYIGSIFNNIYSLNRILFGNIIGGVITLFSYKAHLAIKKLKGKVLLPFQGIVLTVLALVITSIITQLLIA